MLKKTNKIPKTLKKIGLFFGGGGVFGILLALSGICLPCVLVPLGFIGVGLLFLFSFVLSYKFWLLGFSIILLFITLYMKKITDCRDGVCQIDISKKNKFTYFLSEAKTGLLKFNNKKVYISIFVVLFFLVSSKKSGQLKIDENFISESNFYTELVGLSPTIGSDKAKITMIEYSDYFCPSCLPLYQDVITPILEKYGEEIKFTSIQVNVLMDLGYTSAHAALCANEQDKYWDMHNKLLERIRPFINKEKNWNLYESMLETSKEGTPEYFTEISKTIEGIDTEIFLECMKSNKYSDEIAKTTEKFNKFGFAGVPVIIINGKYFKGNPTQENLIKMIDEELKIELAE